MTNSQIRTKIISDLVNITKGSTFVEISKRSTPDSTVTAEILDSHMESHSFLGQKKFWIELSRASAKQHLSLLLRDAQVTWFEYTAPKELPITIAGEFIDSFGDDARFFTNGLINVLDEHPVINEKTRATMLNVPFYSSEPHRDQYGAWNPFNDDPDEEVFGVVAIDSHKIGHLLIRPDWLG
jgi:hypothetical protein